MHLHKMRDSDNHFIIDPTTMIITNKSEKHTLQQGDHNSEVFTFELPKVIEGHDMTQCNLVQIHYINIKGDKTEQIKDVHKVNDIAVSEDEPGTLVFTWTVHGNATKYAGSLNFRIHFYCTDTDGKYTYKKHTEIFKGITISEGFDNAEAVEKDHSDILSQWESRLNALENSGGDSAVLYTEQTLTDEEKAQARKNIGAANQLEYGILIEGRNASVEVGVLNEVDETRYERSQILFLGYDDGTVRLSRVSDGKDDWDAATVGQLKAAVENIPDGVPTVTPADAGKFLRVSANGVWEAQTIANGEEVAF